MKKFIKLQEDHGRYFSQEYVDERAKINRSNPFKVLYFKKLKQYDIVTCYVKIEDGDHAGEYKCRPVIILTPSVINEDDVECSDIIPITSSIGSNKELDKFKFSFDNDENAGLHYEYNSYMYLKNYHDNIKNRKNPLLSIRKDYMEEKIGHLPDVDIAFLLDKKISWEINQCDN